MRYPSGVLDTPLKSKGWRSDTKTITKSGEGAMGGVYFFHSKRGSVKDVVVKADGGEWAKTADDANRLLASAGVRVPKGRDVPVTSKEGLDLMNTAWKVGGFDTSMTGGGSQATEFYRVMSVSEGKSLSSTLKGVGGLDPAELAMGIDESVQLLRDETILHQLTNLIATDLINGNGDRISERHSNLGNVMIKPAPKKTALPRALAGPKVTAIDSEAAFSDFAWNQVKDSLEVLAKDPGRIAQRFLDGVADHLAITGGEVAADLFRNHADYGALKAALTQSLERAALKQASRGMRGDGPTDEAGDKIKQRQRGLFNKLM